MSTTRELDNRLQSGLVRVLVLLAIPLATVALYHLTFRVDIRDSQTREATSGFSHAYASRFIYFYYYTGHFPLATLDHKTLRYSEADALREIQTNGRQLIMEYKHWARLGENARILAYLPNALWKRSPVNPSIKMFNTIVFTLALMLLFDGFRRSRRALPGLLLAMAVLCTPFFLYEVYEVENIFGLLGSVFFLVLGINVHVLYGQERVSRRTFLVAVASSALIAFFSEIRNEVAVVLLSLVLIYALSSNISVRFKLVVIAALMLSYAGTKQLVRGYFDREFDRTAKLVEEQRGHVYTGGRTEGHSVWHPVFCGLGDFDDKYGYAWDDKVAYRYAIPILRDEYGISVSYSGRYHTDDYYDAARLYYKKFDEIPEYESVIKAKVLGDIQADPLWYAEIIVRRVIWNLTATIPVAFAGWLLLPLSLYLVRRRRFDDLKLIAVALPLSATSIAVYAGRGTTFNSVYGYFVLVIVLMELLEHARKRGWIA